MSRFWRCLRFRSCQLKDACLAGVCSQCEIMYMVPVSVCSSSMLMSPLLHHMGSTLCMPGSGFSAVMK